MESKVIWLVSLELIIQAFIGILPQIVKDWQWKLLPVTAEVGKTEINNDKGETSLKTKQRMHNNDDMKKLLKKSSNNLQ